MDTSITIPDTLGGLRLDQALALLLPDLSRTRLKTLIGEGYVTCGGKSLTTPSFKVTAGQTLAITLPEAMPAAPQAQNIDLDIVYEDKDLIVLNKQAGLVVHPAAGHQDGTLVNALLHHCADSLSGIGGVKRPGIVHRLDKDTSGLMLVAKNDHAHAHLSAQLADRSLSRVYHAFIWGVPTMPVGRIEASLGRNPHNRLYMSVRADGRAAATQYAVLDKYAGGVAARVECQLETGRTHQIRVHMAHIKHALIGDKLYGVQQTASNAAIKRGHYEEEAATIIRDFPRQALHALRISFIHPRTGKRMTHASTLPDDLCALEAALKSV